MSLKSTHARYRTELEALARPDAFPTALDAAGERSGWPEGLAWARVHERFEPDREPYATCVLTSAGPPQRLVRIEAFRATPHLRVTVIPPDPGLPALARAVAGPGRSIVRYHPGRRCTVRVDEVGRRRFVKLYADGRGRRVHADGVRLWGAAARGKLAFRIAMPERFDPMLGAVWQESAVGEPMGRRLGGADGLEVAHRVGRAAGSLPRSELRPRARRDRRAELARTALRCAELVRRVPDLSEPARALLAELEAVQTACRSSDCRPIHGALHVSQWLENGVGLTLLDYDSLALGDAELDAATFLADLDVQNRERLPVEQLNETFLSGYEESAGALDPVLLVAYRAQRRVEKALRVARAIRPDGDRKAARRLRGALACLEGAA